MVSTQSDGGGRHPKRCHGKGKLRNVEVSLGTHQQLPEGDTRAKLKDELEPTRKRREETSFQAEEAEKPSASHWGHKIQLPERSSAQGGYNNFVCYKSDFPPKLLPPLSLGQQEKKVHNVILFDLKFSLI